MTIPIICLHCGEDRLIDTMASPSGHTVAVFCKVCSQRSLHQAPSTAVCPKCEGVGVHHSGCEELGKV